MGRGVAFVQCGGRHGGEDWDIHERILVQVSSTLGTSPIRTMSRKGYPGLDFNPVEAGKGPSVLLSLVLSEPAIENLQRGNLIYYVLLLPGGLAGSMRPATRSTIFEPSSLQPLGAEPTRNS